MGDASGSSGRAGGFAMIELVISLGIVTALSLLGLGGIRAMVSTMVLHAAAERQTAGLHALQASLQRAIDQRPGLPPSGEDWIELDTEPVPGGSGLKRMTVATTLAGGGAGRWQLMRVGDRWEYGLAAEEGGRELAGYKGSILVDTVQGQSGEGARALRIRFPDAMLTGPRLGFAFGRFW